MPRYFNLLEAESFLPRVERALREVKEHKLSYDKCDQELGAIAQRVTLTGGMVPPRERIAELRAHKDASARGVKRAVEQLQEIGCLLKDLGIGLVDFPTLYRGEEVYLCWKSGEPGITFWHRIEDGFAGRKPIDSEFLSNHKGEQ
ncbi:MAG TPA: DUF2203 domain-containing protein [Bryobacteraceae bacterium]|nr:DUF2203 domain-containing protein [Bryobacteraceae bacterium]